MDSKRPITGHFFVNLSNPNSGQPRILRATNLPEVVADLLLLSFPSATSYFALGLSGPSQLHRLRITLNFVEATGSIKVESEQVDLNA